MESPPKTRLNHPAWLLLVAPVLWIALWRNLDGPSLHTADEAAHTEVARSILERGRMFDLWFLEGPYYGKPPLKIWLSAALMSLLGQEEWVVRLPDAAFATLTALLLWAIARRIVPGPAALAAPIVFATAPYPLLEHGWREGVQDSALTFLVTLGVLLFLRTGEPGEPWRPWLGMAASLGAAGIVKSVVPFLLYPPIVATLLRSPRRGAILRRVLPCLLLSILPWLVWYGSDLQGELGFNIGRRVIGWHGRDHTPGTYWTWLDEGFAPWSRLFLPAVLLALVSLRWRGERQRWLVLWTAGLVVPWLVPELKHPWYVYPAYPAIALVLASLFFPPELHGGAGRSGVLRRILALALAAAFLAFGRAAVMQAWRIHTAPEPVPIHRIADAVKEQPPGSVVVAELLGPWLTCPDERYYLDLSGAPTAHLRTTPELVSLALDAPRVVALLPEPMLAEALPALLRVRPDVRVATFFPRCRWSYAGAHMGEVIPERQPPRAALFVGDVPLPPELGELPVFTPESGIGRLEGDPAHPFAWIPERALFHARPAPCGTLILEMASFHRPRRARVRTPDATYELWVPAGRRRGYAFGFPASPDGGEVVVEVIDPPCDRPADVADVAGIPDRRCLGLQLSPPAFEPEPGYRLQ